MEIRRYWEICWRRRYLFLWILGIVIGTALVVSLGYQLIFGRIYRIPVQTRIDKQDLVAEFLSDAPQDLGKLNSDNWANNIYTLAQSDSVINRVTERLNLKTSSGKPYSPANFLNPSMIKIIRQRRGVTVELLEDTEMVEIGGISNKPEEAVAIANTFARELMIEVIRSNQEAGSDAVKFYETEIPRLKHDLTLAEDSALEFRVQEHLADVESYRTQLITQQAGLESTILSAERSLRENVKRKEGILEQMDKQPEYRLASQSYSLNPQITNLKQLLLELERQLAVDKLTYTEEHPTIKITRLQIDTTRQQLREQVEKTFSQEVKSRSSYYDNLIESLGNLEIDEIALKSRVDILQQQVDELVFKLDELSKTDTEYQRLLRIVESIRTRYTNALSRMETAKSLTNLNVDNITVFAPASAPSEYSILKTYTYFPKKKFILIIAFLLGFVFAMGTVFVVDYADDRIYQAAHLRDISKISFIGVIGKNPSPVGSLLSLQVLNPELRRQLAEIVSQWKISKGKSGSVISIVSPQNDEGKSFITASLALTLAEMGEKVLVIDGNILSPSIDNLFGKSTTTSGIPGTIEQARTQIQTGPVPSVSFLKLGEMNQSQSLDISRLKDIIGQLKNEYSVILLDTPALFQSRMGVYLSSLADLTYLVSRWGKTRSVHIEQAMDILKDSSITPTGTILNGVKLD